MNGTEFLIVIVLVLGLLIFFLINHFTKRRKKSQSRRAEFVRRQEEDRQKRIRERELERAKGIEALQSRCLKLAEKIKASGFKGTNHKDRQVFIKTINRVTFGNKDVTEEEIILADVCLTNPACFNFLMLRNLLELLN